jgi:glutamate/aspartate transport system substrate-binding protein
VVPRALYRCALRKKGSTWKLKILNNAIERIPVKFQLFALGLCLVTAGTVHARANDTLAKVQASGVVVLGVRDASGALSYALGPGQYGGYQVDICHRIVARLEKEAGKKLAVKYQPVTSQNRVLLVQNGTVDIECGSTTHSAGRAKEAAFSITTYVDEVGIVVRADSGISALAQLTGKRIVTTKGTRSVQLLRKQERATGVEFREVIGKDHADSFAKLASGQADAFVMNVQILAGNMAAAKNPATYRILGETLSVEPVAIMFRKYDPAFKKMADDTIRDLIRSGELAQLYDKWFIQPIPPHQVRIGLPVSEATQAAWATPNDKPVEDYPKK